MPDCCCARWAISCTFSRHTRFRPRNCITSTIELPRRSTCARKATERDRLRKDCAMSKRTEATSQAKPLVVGIGGTTRTVSSTDRALRLALQAAEDAGARTFLFGGAFLSHLPHFAPENRERNEQQRQFVEMVRKADGVIVASPGYHGGVSGLVKNALDLLEDLSEDDPCYLDGR